MATTSSFASQRASSHHIHNDAEASTIPRMFTSKPPILDMLSTPSSYVQDETVQECLPYLTGYELQGDLNACGIPHLDRPRHIAFLQKQLGMLPGAFKSADASRPWIFYWCLAGMDLLGEDVTPFRQKLIETLLHMQSPAGGFSSGFGQMAHLAPTYAALLALTLVGGEEAYEMVDRKAMWRWLCSLKRPDGGFQMAVGGEEDVRCATVAALCPSAVANYLPEEPTAQPSSFHCCIFPSTCRLTRKLVQPAMVLSSADWQNGSINVGHVESLSIVRSDC